MTGIYTIEIPMRPTNDVGNEIIPTRPTPTQNASAAQSKIVVSDISTDLVIVKYVAARANGAIAASRADFKIFCLSFFSVMY